MCRWTAEESELWPRNASEEFLFVVTSEKPTTSAFCDGHVGNTMNLGVNVGAQSVPDVFWHGEKRLDNLGIKLKSGPANYCFARHRERLRSPVGTIGHHRVQGVSD